MSKRGLCRVCQKELSISVDGTVRVHGYARGGDDLSQRCPGSAQPPMDTDSMVKCFYCLGKDSPEKPCVHCSGEGEVPVSDVMDMDAVIIVHRTLEGNKGESEDMIAAWAVADLIEYGFLTTPEETPIDPTDGPSPDGMLLVALMQFYDDWKSMAARGPVKPKLRENQQNVEAALEQFRDAGKRKGA